MERGIKKSVAAIEIVNLYKKSLIRYFYHWKSLTCQEKIIEEFETEGGIRSHQEVYVHNIVLKATRNIFRFYSRKLTDSFYRWKYTVNNINNAEHQISVERKNVQLKKVVEEKQKKLYNRETKYINLKQQLEIQQNEANDLQSQLLHQNNLLKVSLAAMNLEKVFIRRKNNGFNIIKLHAKSQVVQKNFKLLNTVNKVRFY